MGPHEPIRRTIGRDRDRSLLAPCPVEVCPTGGCAPSIPAFPGQLLTSWLLDADRPGGRPHLQPPEPRLSPKCSQTLPGPPSFHPRCTFKTAPELPPGRRCQSLYTGMTARRPPKRSRMVSRRPWDAEQPAVRRSLSGARQPAGPLARHPVEGCPVGGCTPRVPPSTSTCSLRFSRDLAVCPLVLLYFFGTGSFAKVLATMALTPCFWACFTLETAPGLHSYHSRKSLYTGMTADHVYFPTLPQKGGPASPPIYGMVSRLMAPHTRWHSDRQ